MLHRLLAILFSTPALLVAAQPPATTQTSPDQVFDELRRQAMRDYLQQQGDLPELGEKRLADLIDVRRDGDYLAMELKAKPTDEAMHFTLVPGERHGKADIRVSSDGQHITADVQIADFAKSGEVQRQTSVSLNPISISIAAFIHRSLGELSVQLFQTHDGNEVRLRLIVQEDSDISDSVSLHCEARNFTQLRQMHGRELQKYVAPVLRDLGCEQAVFAPPAAVAQQALGIGARVDATVLAELEPLLQRLDSPEFRTRHTATQELRKLDRTRIIALARADRSKWTLNRAAAVDSLLAETDLPTTTDLTELAKQPIFLIDCLYLDDSAVRTEALARLEAIAKHPLQVSIEDPLARRVLAIDRLVDQFIAPTRIDQD